MDYLSKLAFPSHVLMLQRKGIFGKEAVIYVSDAGKFDTELCKKESNDNLAQPKPERLSSYSPGQRPGNESSPTILRPVRAKADVCCYALTGRRDKHYSIPRALPWAIR